MERSCASYWHCLDDKPLKLGLPLGPVQFIKASEALLASLGPQLFRRRGKTRVLLVFGSALARPKEVYELCFAADADAAAMSPSAPVSLQSVIILTMVSVGVG